jgi:hypothetical protein
MEIICCRHDSEDAQKAFRLRYEVFLKAFGSLPDMNHEAKVYIDALDKFSRIYVAINNGKAIATARTIYDRDVDFSTSQPDLYEMLDLRVFALSQPGSLALSSKFAVSSDQRGSFAAYLISAKIYKDALDDGINFLFSTCPPDRINFYSRLGFHIHSPLKLFEGALLAPIVLVIKDWQHLNSIRSPLLKQIKNEAIVKIDDESVAWFYTNYGQSLNSFASTFDASLLDKFSQNISKNLEVSEFKSSHIFNQISANDIEKLISANKLLHVLPGNFIAPMTDYRNEFFIILDGDIQIFSESCDCASHTLGPGDVFAEIAMLSRSQIHASCKAISKTTLAIVTMDDIERLMKSDSNLASRFLHNLSIAISNKIAKRLAV